MNDCYYFIAKPNFKKLQELAFQLNLHYKSSTSSNFKLVDELLKPIIKTKVISKAIENPLWNNLDWNIVKHFWYALYPPKSKKEIDDSLLWLCSTRYLNYTEFYFSVKQSMKADCPINWELFFELDIFENFQYGYSFEMINCEYGAYHGSGYSVPQDTKEMSAKKSKWKNVKDQSNVFYMLFNQNFITQKHLDLNILGKPLYQQIEERGAGSLKELGSGIWLWELTNDEKSLIEEDLIKSGHVIAC